MLLTPTHRTRRTHAHTHHHGRATTMQPKQAHTPGHQPHHIHYGRRWGILGIVALLQLSNAMQWVNYAPVAQLAAAYYHTTCGVIDGLSLCFMAVSIPGTFVSAYIFRKCVRSSLLSSCQRTQRQSMHTLSSPSLDRKCTISTPPISSNFINSCQRMPSSISR